MPWQRRTRTYDKAWTVLETDRPCLEGPRVPPKWLTRYCCCLLCCMDTWQGDFGFIQVSIKSDSRQSSNAFCYFKESLCLSSIWLARAPQVPVIKSRLIFKVLILTQPPSLQAFNLNHCAVDSGCSCLQSWEWVQPTVGLRIRGVPEEMESTLVLYFRPVMSVIVIRPDSAPAERHRQPQLPLQAPSRRGFETLGYLGGGGLGT